MHVNVEEQHVELYWIRKGHHLFWRYSHLQYLNDHLESSNQPMAPHSPHIPFVED